MTGDTSSLHYELILEGPGDSTVPSLQKLKGVLIADLDFNIVQVQAILQSFPKTVKTGSSEEEIMPYYEALLKAGAKVHIVAPQVTNAPDLSAPPEDLSMVLNATLKSMDLSVPEEELNSDNIVKLDDHGILDVGSQFMLDMEPTSEQSQVADSTNKNNGKAPLVQRGTELEEVSAQPADEPVPDLSDALTLALSEVINDALPESNPPQVKPDEINSSSHVPSQDAPLFEFEGSDATPAPEHTEHEIKEAVAKTKGPAPTNSPLFHMLEEQQPPATSPAPQKNHSAAEVEPEAKIEEDVVLSLDEKPEKKSASEAESKKHLRPTTPTIQSHPKKITGKNSGDQTAKPTVDAAAIPTAEQSEAAPENEEQLTPSAAIAVGAGLHRKSRLPLDILVPTLLLGGLLGYANLKFFNAETPKITEKEIDSVLAGEVKGSSANNKRETKKAKAPAPVPTIATLPSIGEVEAEYLKLSWDFDVAPPKMVSGSFAISTSQPQELTPEEIVRNKSLPPWITKLESDNLIFNETEQGIYVAEGKAKTYIEYQGQRTRTSANYRILGKPNDETKEFIVTVHVFAGVEEPLTENTRFAEKLENGGFKFSISKDITVTYPVPTEKPVEPAPENP